MPLVIFPRQGWYAPNGRLFRKSDTKKGPPLEVPERLIAKNERGKYKYLPSSAVVVSDDYVTPMPAPKRGSIDTLSQFGNSMVEADESREVIDAADPGKAEAEAQIVMMEKADQTLAENRAKHQAELVAENEGMPVRRTKKGKK